MTFMEEPVIPKSTKIIWGPFNFNFLHRFVFFHFCFINHEARTFDLFFSQAPPPIHFNRPFRFAQLFGICARAQNNRNTSHNKWASLGSHSTLFGSVQFAAASSTHTKTNTRASILKRSKKETERNIQQQQQHTAAATAKTTKARQPNALKECDEISIEIHTESTVRNV